MFFLKNVSLTAADGVLGTILQAARSLFYWISELIYKFIIILYQLFEDIATARLLDSNMFESIIGKVSVLLGLIMLLIVIFDFVQLLLEPDKMLDKEKGMFSIVKRVLFVLVGLGISGFVFELLFHFQNYVIENEILYRVILPSSETKVDTDNFGKVLSARTFTSFYNVEASLLLTNSDNSKIKNCNDFRDLLISRIVTNGDFSVGYYCLNNVINVGSGSENNDVFLMDYNFLLQIAVGIALAYLLIKYVIQVGVRLIQLTVLQVVSPVFIVGYLSPKKDNLFSKWWKVYFSTYIDIFLRVLIIYFVIYLCGLILDNVEAGTGSVFWDSVGTSSNKNFVMIAMILALLTFAKKAPELIKDLIPASASKLGFGASWKDIVGMGALVGGTAGLAIGSLGRIPGAFANTGRAIGMIKNAEGGWNKFKAAGRALGVGIGGALGVATGGATGIFRGGVAGNKSKGGMFGAAHAAREAQAKANFARAQRQLSGSHWYSGAGAAINSYTGNVSGYEFLEAEVNSYNDLKADIEGEDVVKDAYTTLDIAYQEYYKTTPNAKTKTEWLETEELVNGENKYKAAVDKAKNSAYHDLYNKEGSAFREKVKRHNRSFGTSYGDSSNWKNINDTRKEKAGKLEKKRVQKSK